MALGVVLGVGVEIEVGVEVEGGMGLVVGSRYQGRERVPHRVGRRGMGSGMGSPEAGDRHSPEERGLDSWQL